MDQIKEEHIEYNDEEQFVLEHELEPEFSSSHVNDEGDEIIEYEFTDIKEENIDNEENSQILHCVQITNIKHEPELEIFDVNHEVDEESPLPVISEIKSSANVPGPSKVKKPAKKKSKNDKKNIKVETSKKSAAVKVKQGKPVTTLISSFFPLQYIVHILSLIEIDPPLQLLRKNLQRCKQSDSTRTNHS